MLSVSAVSVRGPLAAPAVAALGLSKRQRLWLLPAVVAAVMCLFLVGARWYYFNLSGSENYCRRMVAKLNKTADPIALRQAVGVLARKYPSGPRRVIGESGMPEPVRRVMKSLGLAEAVLGAGGDPTRRGLQMTAPGGFASFGVVVAPPETVLEVPRKRPGLTVLRWGEGIYVFYFTS